MKCMRNERTFEEALTIKHSSYKASQSTQPMKTGLQGCALIALNFIPNVSYMAIVLFVVITQHKERILYRLNNIEYKHKK